LGWSAFVAMSLFVIILAVGLLYEWKKGGLEWD
ncbi:MAG TPA: NADH-quinone oxidoreductase subunit A, partial [Gemmatimonadetes bacterium]|nr:NADH-quinone oxidoreductase subunit A [Gemmatimonadota bacterium]